MIKYFYHYFKSLNCFWIFILISFGFYKIKNIAKKDVFFIKKIY